MIPPYNGDCEAFCSLMIDPIDQHLICSHRLCAFINLIH